MNIKILLIEDSAAYQEVVAFGLSDEPDMQIVSRHKTADTALRHLKKLPDSEKPDLILLDLNLPGISGLQAINKIKSCSEDTEIIILTESNKEADILKAISEGAVGYLLKDATFEQITDGIRSVMSGGATLDPGMARYLINKQKQPNTIDEKTPALSARESEILNQLADGLLQKQIADELNISPKTVDYHIGNIYKKLKVQNAPAAVAEAFRSGIFKNKK